MIHIPITSLTVLDVIKLIALVIGTIAFFIAAIVFALGDGQKRPTIREQAEINVSNNFLKNLAQERAIEEQQQNAKKWNKHGKFFGYLFEGITYLKRPWVRISIVIIFYLVLFTVTGH